MITQKINKKDIKEFQNTKLYENDYTEDILKAIHLLTFEPIQVNIFGSSHFRNLIYASDIDIIQNIKKSKIPIDFMMKTIINKIISDTEYENRYFITDIKSGFNNKYIELTKYIGYTNNGDVYEYNKEIFEIYKHKYSVLNFSYIPTYGEDDFLNKWLNLYNELHKAIVVRWTIKDINNGYTNINNGDMYLLRDAVKEKTFSKIDLYFFCDTRGKFVEMTNILTSEKDEIKEVEYNIALNGLQYILLKPQNIMKYLKRYYSYERIRKNYNFLKITTPFLTSNISLLYSCYSD